MPTHDAKPFALLSVSDKAELVTLARGLDAHGYRLLSTGGTANFLRTQGFEVVSVSDVTQFPEIMDGRVKTLHPRIHGGLLGRRDLASDLEVIKEYGIADIRVIAVNLYPFAKTVASGAKPQEIVEQIDIGGPAMIRAAAKNFGHVTTLVDPNDYERFVDMLPDGPSLDDRRAFAAKAFAHTADYDARIASWFTPEVRRETWHVDTPLRYGENPHQSAVLLSQGDPLGGWEFLHGKELSYNNLVDADAALQLVGEFDFPTCAIIKHTNPAGCATAETLEAAFDAALACDPVSAFGGIVAVNRTIDAGLATTLAASFWEVILAPEYTPEALDVLVLKKHLRVLRRSGGIVTPAYAVRDTCFGRLEQETDPRIEGHEHLRWVNLPNPDLEESLWFAWKVCKHVKSNAIVLSHGTASVGIGAGQMSRVDSVRLAVEKMNRAFPDGVGPLVLASDAFFPFRDGVDVAAQAGVQAIIQPGGSKRDDEVIQACVDHRIAMAFTGVRHFRH